jgi:hypothetical protein
MLFMELKGIKVGFVTDHAMTGGTYEISADPLPSFNPPLDDLPYVTGKRPDPPAIPTFACILGEPFRMKINFDIVPALAQWAFHRSITSHFLIIVMFQVYPKITKPQFGGGVRPQHLTKTPLQKRLHLPGNWGRAVSQTPYNTFHHRRLIEGWTVFRQFWLDAFAS